jgi:hypothetical protein
LDRRRCCPRFGGGGSDSDHNTRKAQPTAEANRVSVLSTTADNAGQLTIDPNPFYGTGSCF